MTGIDFIIAIIVFADVNKVYLLQLALHVFGYIKQPPSKSKGKRL